MTRQTAPWPRVSHCRRTAPPLSAPEPTPDFALSVEDLRKVYPGRKWVFWQYSGSGLSHGVKGQIDLNVFHGSEQGWHNWLSTHAG